jgi:uncharacterized protein (TIGR02679 family)
VLGGVHTGDGAEWRRTVWASAGVLCQELTSPVFTLNLPGDASTVTGRALAVWREAGQPVHLTVRQILRHPPELRLHGRPVFVCENPAVVAEAANRLGPLAAPLVCASGHPAGAATLLLRRLAEAGATLRYHGDFDWAGLAIANGLVARFGARPWRLDAAAYRLAVTGGRGGPPLRGTPVAAGWDAALTEAMVELSVRVEEEAVLDDLLSDLGLPVVPKLIRLVMGRQVAPGDGPGDAGRDPEVGYERHPPRDPTRGGNEEAHTPASAPPERRQRQPNGVLAPVETSWACPKRS